MYHKYFKLKEEPFANTTDPRFLFRSAGHQEALERLISSVSLRRGINAIIGEPGLGKSTLIRTLLSGLRETVNFAWVFNTTMDAKELLRFICRDFGFYPSSFDKSDLLIELYTFFVRETKEGRTPLLIIDEAQNLQPDALEEIRLLSNLETAEQKLVQIILSGQPQLEAHLALPELTQLRQRITFKATLRRMDASETAAFVRHRLSVAGAKTDDLFSEGALQHVYEISGGIPRLINQICDNALMVAAQRKQPRIDAVLIRELADKGAVMKAPEIERPPAVVAPAKHPSLPPARPRDAAECRTAEPRDRETRTIRDKSDIFEAIDIIELISVI